MNGLLAAIIVVIFSSVLFMRAVDPVIPSIAADLAVQPETATLLSTAFALPYAIVQPVLGAAADMFGKTRLMTICTLLLVVAALAGMMAPNFEVLFASRVVAGVVAGGIFPTALAVVGDLVPVGKRQVVIARLLAAAMSANLIGAALAGAVGDIVGWRGVFAGLAIFSAVASVAALIGFRSHVTQSPARFDLASIAPNYRTIFGNPLAKVCYGAVFLEGIFLFGLFPYIAILLAEAGETRASIAGVVIGGFGFGGIAYTLTVAMLLARFGERRLMAGGGLVMVSTLLTISLGAGWPVDLSAFIALGFGFYMLHGVIQIYATELAPAARASAMSLHSFFFFLGHGIGPLVYGFGLAHGGMAPTLVVGAIVLAATGLACSRLLHRRAPKK